jgi:hypothetical protein
MIARVFARIRLPRHARHLLGTCLHDDIREPDQKETIRVCTAAGRILGALEKPVRTEDVIALAGEKGIENPQIVDYGSWDVIEDQIIKASLVAVLSAKPVRGTYTVSTHTLADRGKTTCCEGPGANEVTACLTKCSQLFLVVVADVKQHTRSSWVFRSGSAIRDIKTNRSARLVGIRNADSIRVWHVLKHTAQLRAHIKETTWNFEISSCGTHVFYAVPGGVYTVSLEKDGETRLVLETQTFFYFAGPCGRKEGNGVYGFSIGQGWVRILTDGVDKLDLYANPAFWSMRCLTTDGQTSFSVSPGVVAAGCETPGNVFEVHRDTAVSLHAGMMFHTASATRWYPQDNVGPITFHGSKAGRSLHAHQKDAVPCICRNPVNSLHFPDKYELHGKKHTYKYRWDNFPCRDSLLLTGDGRTIVGILRGRRQDDHLHGVQFIFPDNCVHFTAAPWQNEEDAR